MGVKTGISWCHHTFNVAWGCTDVSPGCDNCYARSFAERMGYHVWGKDADRRILGPRYWEQPREWDERARQTGERRRVFCSSMADVFDAHFLVAHQLPRLWQLIRRTPSLDWLLLTKRHGRIAQALPEDWEDGYPNVWLGVSAENQEWADRRIPALLQVPARVRFLSVEPMLGPVNLLNADEDGLRGGLRGALHWVICGGESGPSARPMALDWARELRDQCQASGLAFHFKQSSGRRPGLPSGDPALDRWKEFPA